MSCPLYPERGRPGRQSPGLAGEFSFGESRRAQWMTDGVVHWAPKGPGEPGNLILHTRASGGRWGGDVSHQRAERTFIAAKPFSIWMVPSSRTSRSRD